MTPSFGRGSAAGARAPSARESALISAVYTRGVLAAAARAGVPERVLLAEAGFRPDAPIGDGPDAFVPLDRQLALWNAAARLTGDPVFGLHAGEGSAPEQIGALGHAMRAAATVGDAFEHAVRYERLMYTGFVTAVEHGGAFAVVRHEAAHPSTPMERHPVEYVLALILSLARALASGEVRPVEVRFRHAAPDDPDARAELARVFAAPVHFGRADNALVLPAAVLALPVRGADAGVAAALGAHVDALLARVAGTDTTRGRVRTALAELLRGAEPSLAAVARRLAMSERTLQRRLAAEGVAFQAVLDETRRDLALGYLRGGPHAVGEVAFLTGFSEPSAFRRAFRRWTGLTPAEHLARPEPR